MKGNYISPTSKDSVDLALTISRPITTRSDLATLLANPKTPRGTVYSQERVTLTSVKPLTKVSWELQFDASKYLGSATNGIYGFGIAQLGSNVQETIPVPWFYGSVKPKATNVVLITSVATRNTHLADGSSQSLSQDSANLSRLNKLLDTQALTTWSVDPLTVHWLQDLEESKLSESSKNLLAKIEAINAKNFSTVYAYANLKALAKQNPADISSIVQLSDASLTNPALYFPSQGKIGNQTLTYLKQYSDLLPVISNQFIYGGKNETSSAHVLVNDTNALIADQGASECFLRPSRFSISICLNATVAMMTAQTPNAPRTVLVVTPTHWSPNKGDLKAISSGFSNQVWGQQVSLQEALAAPAVRIYRQLFTTNETSIDQSLIIRGNSLVKRAQVLGTAFGSTEFTSSYDDVRLRTFSDLWTDDYPAIKFLTANEKGLEQTRNHISIQSSARVTIANSKTEIPITVANHTIYPVTVNVVLTSKSKSRFKAKTGDFVTVPANQRVTVGIKIELMGSGSVEATARLKNLDGQYLGVTKTMQITSSAYQSIARTLVWGAFGLLVIFAVLNTLRKRRKPEVTQQESLANIDAE